MTTEASDPTEPARPRGWTSESLLASLLLHLAVLLAVILFAPRGGGDNHHDAVVVDIGSFTLPAPGPEEAGGGAVAAAPEDDAVPIPSVASTFEPDATPAPEPAAEEPVAEAPAPEPAPEEMEPEAVAAEEPPEEPLAEPFAETAPESGTEGAGANDVMAQDSAAPRADHPPVPETLLPHSVGEYDPFEVYKAALAQKVHDLTASVEFLPARTLFVGKLAVHLYLDPEGWHLENPKVCMGHSEIYLAAMMPEPVAQRHFEILVHSVVTSLTAGAPFPPAPAGVQLPRELTTFIALGTN